MKFLATSLIVFGLYACKARTHNDSETRAVLPTGVNAGSIKASGSRIDIRWPCTGKESVNTALKKTTQEEYCEWNQSATTPGKPLTCFFRVSFDQSRKYYLTQRALDGSNPDNAPSLAPFSATQFNSLGFLIGARDEKHSHAERTGIIRHCVKPDAQCVTPHCVSSRASDPNICSTIRTLAAAGCNVRAVLNEPPVVTANKNALEENRRKTFYSVGDTEFKLQLAIRDGLEAKAGCEYIADPNFTNQSAAPIDKTLIKCSVPAVRQPNLASCDQIASHLDVVARLEVTNAESCQVLGAAQ